MNIWAKDRIPKLFKKISAHIKNTGAERTDIEYILQSVIDTLEMPSPKKDLYKYLVNKEVVTWLLLQIHNSDNLTREDREKIQSKMTEVFKLLPKKYGARYFLCRALGKGGTYPNIVLERRRCTYTNRNHIPLFITINNVRAEEQFENSSEVQWITRNELRLATSIICAPESGFMCMPIPSMEGITLHEESVKQIPAAMRQEFFYELLRIQRYMSQSDRGPLDAQPSMDAGMFRFVSFKEAKPYFQQLFDAFSIRNHLLMRTCQFLFKGATLWGYHSFCEEAIANVFFCLEGCLHLLQEKYGVEGKTLNMKQVKNIVEKELPHGENLFDFIEEGYEKRVAIVHAKPFGKAEWRPFLMADDFYEYFQIARELINFILIDRIIELM